MADTEIMVGWQEWCALPKLHLPAVKVKIDTGAKTSSLHAINIETFEERGRSYAAFDVHPVQQNNEIVKHCVAPLVDQRHVKSSSGHQEHRCVIATPITLGGQTWMIHITLTDRDAMGMRMLLGREAMQNRILVNASESFRQGKLSAKTVMQHYTQ